MSVMIATGAAGNHIPSPAKGKYEYAPPIMGRSRAVASAKGGIGGCRFFSPNGNEEAPRGGDCGPKNRVDIMNACGERRDDRRDRWRKFQPERERKHQEQHQVGCVIAGEALADVTNTRPRRQQHICSNRGGRRGGRPVFCSGANLARSRRALRTVTPSSSCISRNESRHDGDLWTLNEGKGDNRQSDAVVGSCLPSDKENSSNVDGIEGLLHKPNSSTIAGRSMFAISDSEDVSLLFNYQRNVQGEHDDVQRDEGEAPFGEDVYEALEAMYDEDDGDVEKRHDVSVTAIDPVPLNNGPDPSNEQDLDVAEPSDFEQDLDGCSFLDIANALDDSMSSQLTDVENNHMAPVQRECNKANVVPPFNFHRVVPRSAEEGAGNVSTSLPPLITGCSTVAIGDGLSSQTLPNVVTPSSEVCPDDTPSNYPSQSAANTRPRFSFGGLACLATDFSPGAGGTTAAPSTQDPLEAHSRSFQECTFALPKLKRSMQDEVERCMLEESNIFPATHSGSGRNEAADAKGTSVAAVKEATVEDEDDRADIIAKRRVHSAVCAFGGNKSGRIVNDSDRVDKASSWRGEGEGNSSDISHTQEDDKAPRPKKRRVACERRNANNPDNASYSFPCGGLDQNSEGKDTAYPCKVPRYRCSQCGLPKQNHVCSVESSLHRSIGVMVYPAVNAFTSHEDGLLAPPLSQMNNFLTHSLALSLPSLARLDGEISPGRRSPTLAVNTNLSPGEERGHLPVAVTPESSLRGTPTGGGIVLAEESFLLSTERISPLRASTPLRTTSLDPPFDDGLRSRSKRRQSEALVTHPSSWVESEEDDGLFLAETVELRPEQFRIATPPPSTVGNGEDAIKPYQYPSVPLPYGQRKRFHDALLKLSARVGGEDLKEGCSAVLKEARGMGLWDLAVAELLTQVVVAMNCPPEDRRLDGLSRYLLKLGIAC